MAYCKNCGVVIEDNITFCPQCGQSQEVNVNVAPQWREANNISQNPSGLAVASLIVGVISLILVLMNLIVPVVHLFGLVGGIVAVSISGSPRRKKEGYAIAVTGMILGIIAICLAVLFIIIGIAAQSALM